MTTWGVERARGPAAGHHGRTVPEGAGRAVWVLDVDRPALVLGSTQPEADVDHGAAHRLGVEVVRRRSGGGAVLLDPGEVAWVDVVVPRGDELWHDDVAVAAEWLGEAWAGALEVLGVAGPSVHRGGHVRTPLAPVVCFAGTGPGEVLVAARKAVGISQRRTRAAARFQCAVPLVWRPERHAELLAPGVRRALPGVGAPTALADVAVLPVGSATAPASALGVDDVVEALLSVLP